MARLNMHRMEPNSQSHCAPFKKRNEKWLNLRHVYLPFYAVEEQKEQKVLALHQPGSVRSIILDSYEQKCFTNYVATHNFHIIEFLR